MSKILKSNLLGILNLIAVVTLLSIVSVYLLNKESRQKIVHFDNAKVFSEFNLSKELSALGMQQINPQKKKVDSLVVILQQKENLKNKEEIERLFMTENTKLQKMSETISNQTNYQIWSRINEYAKAFGDQKEYQIILGTTGNGNIMYAESSVDVTNDFIAYANKKYEGE